MKQIILSSVLLLCVTSICVAQKCEPKPIRAVVPHYPHAAIAVNATGRVTVEMSVDANGKVRGVEATQGSKWLKPISELAAREWLFLTVPKAECDDMKFVLIFDYILLPSTEVDGPGSWSRVIGENLVEIRRIRPVLESESSPSR